MQDQLHRMEAALVRVETMLHTLMKTNSEKAEAAVVAKGRRSRYAETKKLREKGRLSLPDFHVLKRRDRRLTGKFAEWARVGLQYGAADMPERFLTWLCYQWNATCYLKKAVTYSGGYFRVHTGTGVRHNYGPFDLMGYNKKQRMVLRNEGEYIDFRDRPWWNWAFHVLYPVFREMEESDSFEDLGERFVKSLRILLGGYGEYEVYTQLFWDPNDERTNVNRMLKRVGPDLRRMWSACCDGLRMKAAPAGP